ncbi:MAG: hypothetical protein ACREMY_16625, partial [bacterium]
GDDMKILRKIASLVGATRIATEAGVAVIELKGFDRWDRVEHFEWFAKTFLQGSVEVFVLLDRDWRPETACAEIKRKLASVGVSAHIWSRKELESYLLNPTSLARVTGASEEWLSDHIRKRSAELRPYIRKNFVRRRVDSAVADLRLQAESDAQAEFRALWALEDNRADLVPPKRLLTLLNTDLQSSALRTTSFRTIAQRMRKEEVAHEMSNLLERLEDHAADR